MGINITEAAASEIRRVMEEQNRPELKYVRVGVVGGGCSGFQYSSDFTNSYDETADTISEMTGFSYAHYLQTAYRERYGKTPGAFRKETRGK